MQFEGIYTPIVTPYHDDFSLNETALAQTVDHLVAAGVHGIIVAGSTGEYYAQSMEERLDALGQDNAKAAAYLLELGTMHLQREVSH